nr:MFS transporter [Kineosporia sp. A_224]
MPRLPRLPMVDLTPLRTSRDFRLLLVAGTVTYLGAMVTYVALPWQLYALTGSNLAVGMLGAVELVPLVVFGLWGGAIADHYDRRTVLVTTTVAQVALTALLLVNAHLPTPQVWALYVVGALLSAVTAAHRPSREALLPRVVRHDELPGALALSSIGMQTGLLAGPAIGGLILASGGATWAYAVDVVGLSVAAVLYVGLRPAPVTDGGTPPSVAGIVEGIRYAAGRRDLLGTYVIDMVAMFLAMPVVLFPAFATDVLRQPELLGLLYSAGTAGSLVATATSGWTARVHHHGRVVVVAAACWGLATAAAGLASAAWLVLVFFALAGAADMVSALFRQIIWNQTIPDERRGRLAGIEMLSYSVGPLGGQVRAGVVADGFGVRTSIVSGGVLCAVGVVATAAWLREFWGYDARTDEHAVRERDLREERARRADETLPGADAVRPDAT